LILEGFLFIFVEQIEHMKALLTLVLVISSFYYVFIMDSNTSLKTLFTSPESSVESSTQDVQSVNVYIKGLNSYDASSLETIKETLEKFGFICKIDEPIQTSYNGTLCSELQNELSNDSYFDFDDGESITIYVTNNDLVDQNISVAGLCYGNSIYISNTIYVNQTITHELLHSFGLEHCENSGCIMSINNRDRWNNQTDMPIFCDDCRLKAPSQFLN
jgi:hypothetical protein